MDRQGSGARTTSIVCIHRIKWDNTSYCSRAGITICHIQDHLLKKIPSRISENHAGLTSQSLHATVGPLQDNRPLFHYVIGISGILPYKHVFWSLEIFSACSVLSHTASCFHSAGSSAINQAHSIVLFERRHHRLWLLGHLFGSWWFPEFPTNGRKNPTSYA